MKYKKNSLCVDASCIGNPGVMEYRIFDISENKMVWESQKFNEWTNNLGEFLAIVEALRMYKSKKYDCIYSDSQTAIAWAKTKKIKTTLKYSAETKKLLEKIEEAKIRLKTHEIDTPILKRETEMWWEIPADYWRK